MPLAGCLKNNNGCLHKGPAYECKLYVSVKNRVGVYMDWVFTQQYGKGRVQPVLQGNKLK